MHPECDHGDQAVDSRLRLLKQSARRRGSISRTKFVRRFGRFCYPEVAARRKSFEALTKVLSRAEYCAKAVRLTFVSENPFPNDITDVWTPLVIPGQFASSRSLHRLRVVARLRDGVDMRQAQSDMAQLSERLGQRYPATDKGWEVGVSCRRTRGCAARKVRTFCVL
jgi:hypothetical protein